MNMSESGGEIVFWGWAVLEERALDKGPRCYSQLNQ